MKDHNVSYTLMLCFLIFTCLLSCSKKESIPEKELPPFWVWDYWGEVTALKDGADWEAKIYGHSISPATNIGFDINIDYFNEQGARRGNLHLYRIPLSIGKHAAINSIPQDAFDQPGAVYLTIEADGDVVGTIYDLIDSFDNYIELTAIEGDEVWGKFQFTMLDRRIPPDRSPIPSDTLRFTEGYFHTRMHEPE